ncbi:MAG: amidohydrolase family protein [Terriglobia bacterium]
MAATPWGEIEVFDAHLHFFSPAFFESLAHQKGVPEVGTSLGWDIPSSCPELADRWIAELDSQGVAAAVLIASIPNDTGSVAEAVKRAEAAKSRPERLHAVSMVNPLVPGPVPRSIFLFPAMHRYSLHDERVIDLMERAARHPAPLVYVHCGALSVGFRRKLGLPSAFDMAFSNPIDLHALAVQFPGINFVIPHFGAGYFREALMVADLCPNVYLDTSSSNKWMRYQTEEIDLRRVFRRALEVVGPSRLLFGSDSSWFPRGWVRQVFDDQVAVLAEIGVSRDTACAILGGNSRRIIPILSTTAVDRQ